MVGLVDRRRHRLVHVHVPACLERQPAVRVVQTDRADDGDGVDGVVCQHRLDVGVGVGNAEPSGCVASALDHRIAQGGDAHEMGDVVLDEVRQHGAQGERPNTDDAQPHGAGFFSHRGEALLASSAR